MRKILLINFGRMGDLLQTSPLIAYLKEQPPSAKIALLFASGFREVVAGIPGVDELYPLELIGYMRALKSKSPVENFGLYRALLQDLKAQNYDAVFNLTHNRLGAGLAFLLKVETVGMTLDNQGLTQVKNPWMRLFLNSNINRGLNQFNLVDLYKLSAGYSGIQSTADNLRLHFRVNPTDRDWAEENLKDFSERPVVGIQVGASSTAKRWPVGEFRNLAQALARDFNLIFLGTSSEIPLVVEASNNIPARNFAGRTTIGQLSALLERCTLLISNDTGTQHLSSAVGTAVLSITLGPAWASETGPYGEGHIVVEADCECMPCHYKRPCFDYKCHSYVKASLVEWIARRMLSTRAWEEIPEPMKIGIRIHRTAYDDDGLWYLQAIVPGADKLRREVNLAYRKTWYRLLSDNNNNKIDFQETFGKDIAKDVKSIALKVRELSKTAERGEVLAEKLSALATDDMLNITAIKEMGSSLAEIDQHINAVGESCPELRPLTLDFNLGKEALPDAGLSKLSKDTAELYSHLGKACRLFGNLMISRPLEIRKVLAINAPYYVSGEILRAMVRAGAVVETVDLDLRIKDDSSQVEAFCHRLMEKVKSFQPDFLFTVNHLGFDSQGVLLKELERMKVPVVVYYVDSPFLIMERPERLLSEISLVFCWDAYYAKELKKIGFHSEYLPLATDQRTFYPRPMAQIPLEFRVKIAYAAHSLTDAIDKHRQGLSTSMLSENIEKDIKARRCNNGKVLPEILTQVGEKIRFDNPEQRRAFDAYWILKFHQQERLEILRALNGLNLTLFGDEAWREFIPVLEANFHPVLRYTDQLPMLYSGMEIGFNVTSLQMPESVNQRVFDIPSAGGFILTDYRPALEEILDTTQDLAIYHSPAEARELAEYYLARPELRAKMANSAREKVLKYHTYDHRAQAILSRMVKFNRDEFKLSKFSKLNPELSAIQKEFNQTFDAPEEISRHRFGDKFLLIAPDKSAWVVMDEMGSEIIERLSRGATMGNTAVDIAEKYRLSAETALIKLREILEKMYLSNFRQSYKPQILDIDANRRNLQLFLTRNCNLNCRHCYFSAGKALAEELSTEEWKRIIRSFAHLGQGNAVTFTGGEPLTHPDFFDIAQTAMDNGLKVILLTNGGLIKDRAMARKIADLTDTVQVSLDGATAETNDAIRGVGSFAGAVNGIRLLLAEKAEVEMTCVVLPENVEDLEKNLTKFIEEFASSRLRCSLSVANPKGRLKGVEIAEAESLVGRVISACGNVNWLRKGGFHSGQGCFGCEIANSIVVNPSGKIGNCPYLNYSGPGKIKDEDFAKLIETDRVWHRQAIKDSDKCRNCDLRNFQCGGCKIFGACTEQLKLRNYYRMLYGN